MPNPWTPGPWKWKDYDATPQAQQALFTEDGSETVLFHQANWKVCAADARLIAAAPEMAELLAKAVRTQADPKYHTPTHWVAESAALLARIRGEA